jgi:ABC-type nitrate/sulfonate/bicarbonate transport system substrate-binding protein
MPLRRRGFIALAVLASLSEFASACGSAVADDLRVVRVLEVPTDGAKSVLYAQKANLFRKRGIQADIVPMGSGAAIYSAVVGGSATLVRAACFRFSRPTPTAFRYASSHRPQSIPATIPTHCSW